MKKNQVILFKIEDFNTSIKNSNEDPREYLHKLNEILNEEDYWDWKPVLLKLVNEDEIKPLWHSINSTGNSKEYTFEFVISKLLDKKDKEVITKEFENLFDTGDEDIDEKAIIVIRSFFRGFGFSEYSVITIRKIFTF